ncbi:unnamed protein product [Closterium sp. NIES-53]
MVAWLPSSPRGSPAAILASLCFDRRYGGKEREIRREREGDTEGERGRYGGREREREIRREREGDTEGKREGDMEGKSGRYRGKERGRYGGKDREIRRERERERDAVATGMREIRREREREIRRDE